MRKNFLQILKDWNSEFERKMRVPFRYRFIQVFSLSLIIYFFACAFDFCFTYLTYHVSPEHFFAYEFSWVAKEVGRGNAVIGVIGVFCFFFPIFLTYFFYVWERRKYGNGAGYTRFGLIMLLLGSYMHMWGGFTNFIYLTNLNYV
jgi:hypothetical protein